MSRLMTVALVGGLAAMILGGLGKMLYELKKLASQPPRQRQPWEYDAQ
jgi:hypothetical protein